MLSLATIHEISGLIHRCQDLTGLHEVLSHAGEIIQFDYFAVHHHLAAATHQDRGLRIHNYPREWEERYDRRRLGLSDPVHRASQMRGFGFRWRHLPDIISFRQGDALMLDEAKQFGIRDGFTIPAHVPGERPGSVTFAFAQDKGFADEALLLIEGLGHFAFEQARIISGPRLARIATRVTDRMLEIVLLIGQDKTNGEIAQILGIKEDTVAKHVQTIFERFGAVRRTSLPLRAVSEGLLIFDDFLR